MNQKHLTNLVFLALSNCKDNGYNTMGSPREIVAELKQYDSDLESQPVAKLLPLVKKWQKKFGSTHAEFVTTQVVENRGIAITTRMYRDSNQACVTTMSIDAAHELRRQLNNLLK